MKKGMTIIFFTLLAALLYYGSVTYEASCQALAIWFEKLVPSLFAAMVVIRILDGQGLLVALCAAAVRIYRALVPHLAGRFFLSLRFLFSRLARRTDPDRRLCAGRPAFASGGPAAGLLRYGQHAVVYLDHLRFGPAAILSIWLDDLAGGILRRDAAAVLYAQYTRCPAIGSARICPFLI